MSIEPDSGDIEAFRHTLEEAKRASTAQLLFKCARLLNERALATLPPVPGDPGSGAVRPRASHTALFPHIRLEGTRQSDIARRVGISKQAVGQLVDELETMNMVTRRRDPHDGRAKLVMWTDEGRQAMLAGLDHLRRIEVEMAEVIGQDRWAALRDALLHLHDHLDPDDPAFPL